MPTTAPARTCCPGTLSRSDPVADAAQPRRHLVVDLRKLLHADKAGPMFWSVMGFGGMVARRYATLRPGRIAGLVSIDAQNEDFVAGYKEFLTPEQYLAAVLDLSLRQVCRPYSAVERLSLEISAAQVRQAQADTPLRRMPLTVLSTPATLQNPFGFPPDWPINDLERAFQASRDMLAELVPGARHCDRRQERALHSAGSAQTGDPEPSGRWSVRLA